MLLSIDCSKISQNHNNNLRTKRKNYVNMRLWRAGQGCYISPGKPIYSLERALIRTGCTTVSPLLSFENGWCSKATFGIQMDGPTDKPEWMDFLLYTLYMHMRSLERWTQFGRRDFPFVITIRQKRPDSDSSAFELEQLEKMNWIVCGV